MTTKEQERKALEKIRKIVEELGTDSYVAMALDGCIDIAEENITNDWACSLKGKYEWAERVRQETAEELIDVRKERDEAREEAKRSQEDRDEWKRRWENKAEELKGSKEANRELWDKFRAQEDRANTLEQEIIKLKAKLYDLITAE